MNEISWRINLLNISGGDYSYVYSTMLSRIKMKEFVEFPAPKIITRCYSHVVSFN